MSKFTNFSMSTEKGLRGNIGKITTVAKKNGEVFKDVMLFLVPNGDVNQDEKSSQIVNVHFPQAAFPVLEQYGLQDYVRIHFDRIDLAKGISKKTGEEVLYISVKANDIELLKKAELKETSAPEAEKAKSGWGKKQVA